MAYTTIPASSSGGGTSIADQTILGNISGVTANAVGLTVTQVQTLLSIQASSAVAITGGTIAGTAINMGGNSLIGDTVSAGKAVISSTSHATKGTIQLGGTTGFIYNEATGGLAMNTNDLFFDPTNHWLGIGTVTPRLTGGLGVNARGITLTGASTVGGALELQCVNAATTRVAGSIIGYNGTNFLAEMDIQADGANNSGRYLWSTNNAGSIGVRMLLSSGGSLVLGSTSAALATTATDGFLYIPTCAGLPTGVPTTWTGTVPMIFNTTSNRLMIYDGGWLGATVPGTFV